MAKNFRKFSTQRSQFAWLGSGSPLAAWVSFPVPKEFRDVLTELLEKSRKEGDANAKSEVEKALAGRAFELIKQNFADGEIDMGLAIQGPHKSPSGVMLFGMVGGMKVHDGKEVERLVRDAIAKQPPEKDVRVAFEAAKGEDGTPIHQVTFPESGLDPNMIKKLGKSPLYFAFPSNAIVVSYGEGGLKAIQQGLGNLVKGSTGASAEPAALQSRLSLLAQFAESNPDAVREAASHVLEGASANRDCIRLTFKTQEQAVRLQLAVGVPALKLALMIGQLRASQPAPK
jgi:hypothetical protein